jgi:LPS export ABC transporter protein LptC
LRTFYQHIISGVTTTLGVVVILVLTACRPSVKDTLRYGESDDTLIVMRSYDVETFISDSGITRYRVVTPEWLVVENVEKPCWKFPRGLHLEQFDESLFVYSELESKYAIYYLNNDIWELYDSVRVKNVDNEYFETDKLIIEKSKESVHTDQYVKVIQKDRIITGLGMTSNLNMTRYVIEKPQGVIPLEENEDTAADTIQLDEP